jgi:hypothetical protein
MRSRTVDQVLPISVTKRWTCPRDSQQIWDHCWCEVSHVWALVRECDVEDHVLQLHREIMEPERASLNLPSFVHGGIRIKVVDTFLVCKDVELNESFRIDMRRDGMLS